MKIDERRRPAAAGEELPDIREQEPLLQLRRQVQRRRHVGEQAMELGHQPRELRCARTNCLAKDRRRHQPRCFLEHFDERDQRGRALLLVTSADQRLAPEAPRGSQRFFRESGFADPRVAEEQNEAAAAGPRLLDALQQLSALGVASDQPRPVVARRSIDDRRRRLRGEGGQIRQTGDAVSCEPLRRTGVAPPDPSRAVGRPANRALPESSAAARRASRPARRGSRRTSRRRPRGRTGFCP